ncbi:MAG TPA: PAS domain S-box protein [Candidatus Acidoferrales bacterium]|nr:PAS domain S-box protein [Candidatus Acidoferrales bacterium]
MIPSTANPPVITLTGKSESPEDTSLKQLRASEERFRLVAENSQVWVWEADSAGIYTYASQAVEKILGYTPQEVVGKNYLYFITPEDKHSVEQNAQIAASKQPFFRFFFRGLHKNGSIVWLSSNGFPLLDAHDQLTGYRGNTIDITAIKQAEEQRLISEEKYRHIFEDALDTIFTYDMNGIILSINSNVENYGFTKEQIIGKQIAHFVPKKYWTSLQSQVAKVSRGKVIQGEIEVETPIGIRFVEYKSNPVIFENKVIGGLSVMRDITDRKNAEEKLIESQLKFEALFGANPDAALFVDNDYRIIEANNQFTKLFGYSLNELKGNPVDVIITPEEAEESKRIRKIVSQQPIETIIVRHRKDGSEIHVLLSGAPVIVKGKLIGMVMVYKDISSLLIANEKLSQALNRAELLNEKLTVIGGFTRHDVRNKLMAINGNVYLAEKYAKDNDRLTASLNRIKETTNNIVSILTFAKDFEMLGTQALVDIDVGKALDEAISLFSEIARVKITNQCHDFTVRADAMLTTVFHNLIDNSLKYGQTITEIKVYKRTEGDSTKIIYEDDGVGIDAETKKYLFVKGIGRGTGYGLYLIKRTCEIYGWDIKETAEQGMGVRFEFTITPQK